MENKMIYIYRYTLCFSGGAVVKTPPANAGNAGLIPGSGRSPGVGNDNPLQNSCLENPMDRGAWQVTVHGVARAGHNLVTRETESNSLVITLSSFPTFH